MVESVRCVNFLVQHQFLRFTNGVDIYECPFRYGLSLRNWVWRGLIKIEFVNAPNVSDSDFKRFWKVILLVKF